MKLGYLPPMTKGFTTNPRYMIPLVEMLEDEGIESIWGVEHVIMAEDYEPLYPYSEDGRAPTAPDTQMPDPLEWLSFIAARTTKLRLGTSVLIASQHNAVVLAKRVATLDALSAGRFSLGVGIGWQREEYEAVGVAYRDRGRRLDECIDAMRVLWEEDVASFEGRHFRFDKIHLDTRPAQAGGVPILIGGSSEFAARRAGVRGDGFYPYVISPEDYASRIETMRAAALEVGRDPDRLELSVWPGSYDFSRTFDIDLVREYREIGVHRVVVSTVESQSLDIEVQRDFLRRYQDEILAKL
jgi:probable F420-dependent oxidoreductase